MQMGNLSVRETQTCVTTYISPGYARIMSLGARGGGGHCDSRGGSRGSHEPFAADYAERRPPPHLPPNQHSNVLSLRSKEQRRSPGVECRECVFTDGELPPCHGPSLHGNEVSPDSARSHSPAQVPMMSPNGSVPPIYVPPGYISQIIEENGVRRVLVLPQPEYHPGSHSPLHPGAPPPHHAHLPTFIPHPAMMPPPPPHMYSPVPGGPGGGAEIGSQYIPQYHAPHFCEPDAHAGHTRPAFSHRDERANKTYERLQKKLKERQGGAPKDKGASPPPSPQKNHKGPSSTDAQNGLGQTPGSKGRQGGRSSKGSPSGETEPEASPGLALDPDLHRGYLRLLFRTGKHFSLFQTQDFKITRDVTDIQARTALLTWAAPGSTPGSAPAPTPATAEDGEEGGKEEEEEEEEEGESEKKTPEPMSYEVSVSNNGKDGKYRTVYRVQALCGCVQGIPTEAVSFTTLSCEPDTPTPPRKTSGTKSALVLQWKAPCDNGSKIQNYILQWDERPLAALRAAAADRLVSVLQGKGTGEYEQCYYGPQKQYRVTKLSPASQYSFRLAAKNDLGTSGFSEAVDFFTSCSVPAPPVAPELLQAGVSWLSLQWQRPAGSPKEDDIYYALDMEEEGSGYGFQPRYDGEELSCTVKNLRRSTKYRFRVRKPALSSAPSECSVSEREETSLLIWPSLNPPHAQRTSSSVPSPCPLAHSPGGIPPAGRATNTVPPRGTLGAELSQSALLCLWLYAAGTLWELVYSGAALEHLFLFVMCWRLRSESPGLEVGGAQGEEFREAHQGAELDCTTPVCNGAPVSEFRLEWGAAEGSMQVCYTGTALSHEMKGLHPATMYFCRIQAANVAGSGPFSEVVLCQTPCSVPAAVSSIHALREAELSRGARGSTDDEEEEEDEDCDRPSAPRFCPSSCLGLGWEPPCDHGSEITAYCIDLGDRQPITVGPVTRYIIQHLQPDTSYRIRIQALNSLGAGPFSHMVKLKTKPLPPPPPRLECTAQSHQTLRLKWGEGPPKTAPSDTLQYQLQMEDKNGRFVLVYRGPCHTHKVQRLTESTSYSFRIQALNEAGEGPLSDVYTFTTPRSPPAALKAPRIERLDEHTCEVTWEAAPPMKGDPIIYILQSMMGNSEFKQVRSDTTPYSGDGSDEAERIRGYRRDIYTSHNAAGKAVEGWSGRTLSMREFRQRLALFHQRQLFREIYRGSATSHQVSGLQPNSEYRFRVCAVRHCQTPPDLTGPYSATATLSSQRVSEATAAATATGGGALSGAGPKGAEPGWASRGLSDEMCATLIIILFAVLSILIAFVIHYFVM
ncbi:hypothetical protein JZ751_013941 [Albula glossodonta]|uniref:Fibronectin type-III domain-containing protein n=1 Tax=Albula glossodonta TaxID=121402 RepID=A0A8T2MZG8_9TELE|nr:hypothetical protein JZ751_013941 [Albula glossodonta]